MCNGIMGTPPGEEMFRTAFETAQANVRLKNPKMKVSWITGDLTLPPLLHMTRSADARHPATASVIGGFAYVQLQ